MSVITNNLLLGEDGYNISRSVRLRSSASAYFNRTPAGAGNRKTWTWSAWVKRGSLGVLTTLFGTNVVNNDSQAFAIYFGSDDKLGVVPWSNSVFVTNAVFRDPSAWYHIVVAFDSTQATAANRVKVYINGVNQSGTYPLAVTLNTDYAINQAGSHRLGDFPAAGFGTFDGYLTEINFIDGQALTPSSFGETGSITGVWKPKKYAGTYGTNGFFLNFSDNSNNTAATIGKDSSGNGNNWTPNNISVTAGATYDSMLDVPTMWADGGNGRGNYAVINPLATGADATISNANLSVAYGTSATISTTLGTFGMSSGQWYWENTITASSLSGATSYIGMVNQSNPTAAGAYPGATSGGWSYYGNLGTFLNNGSNVQSGLATYGANDVIGIAFDADAGTLKFYKNNTQIGTTITGIAAGTYFPAWSDGSVGNTFTIAANFGQRPFAYTPPTGFKALNTQNLPAGSITTSGSFTGNASADGPFVYLNGVPTAMTINGNAVTFATHADKTANGFKVRSSSSSYNASGSNTYSITTTGAKFKYANAQGNP